jgi:hypothetical protein
VGPVVDTAGSFTIAAWVRLDTLTGYRTAVNQDGTNVSGFWLQYSASLGNKFGFIMHDADATTSNAVRAVSTTTPVVGQWYHLTAVRDRSAGTMKLYVNGALEATTAYAGGWAANGALNVGRGKWINATDWFAGAIDEVQAYGGVLTAADIAQLVAQAKTPIKSAWKFDDGAGASVADSAGTRPLTQSNATWVAGKTGNALKFNGTTAFAAAAGAVVDTAASYSVAAWVRLDSLTGARTAVSQDGTNVSAFWLQFSQGLGNKFAFIIHSADATNSTPTRAVSTTTAVAGQWYHLVAVRNKAAGAMKLYVNGRLEATTAYAGGWASNGNLTVGRAKWSGSIEWFAGTVDEARVYSGALTDAEVTALFTGP